MRTTKAWIRLCWCYIHILKTSASFCSWAGRFEYCLVATSEDRFSHYMLIWSPGCYDGNISTVDAHFGHILWQFQTGSKVKSSPMVDMATGLVYVGSHGHCLYALNIEVRYLWANLTTVMFLIFRTAGLSKQCRPRSDCSGSTLFAIPSSSFGRISLWK